MKSEQTQITVSVPSQHLLQVDSLIAQNLYNNHADVIEVALERVLRAPLDAQVETEAAKLDRQAESDEAEAGMDIQSCT